MLGGYLVPKQIAVWNSVRGVWEKPGVVNLLCEHWGLFSETWPTSGTMRNGRVFGLPMRGHLTNDSESLLLRTPVTSDGEHSGPKQRDSSGHPSLSMQVMATPTTSEATGPGRHGTGGENLRTQMANLAEDFAGELLRTPAASEAERGHQPEDVARARGGQVTLSGQTNFGGNFDRFEPAVRRWEKVTGNLAPSPTKPDGRDGARRLSSELTEWMMGLPKGWITGLGLSRKDELKACGNGVVPQQAALALSLLLNEIPKDFTKGE